MTALRDQTMSVDEFLAWAERQPDRWELLEGIPAPTSPERVVHGDVKYRVARALDIAIAQAKVPCRFVLDSAAVRIDQAATGARLDFPKNVQNDGICFHPLSTIDVPELTAVAQ
jgi:hypothetical protein